MKRELKKDTDPKEAYNVGAVSKTVNLMIKRVLEDVTDGRSREIRCSETIVRRIAHDFKVSIELSNSDMKICFCRPDYKRCYISNRASQPQDEALLTARVLNIIIVIAQKYFKE